MTVSEGRRIDRFLLVGSSRSVSSAPRKFGRHVYQPAAHAPVVRFPHSAVSEGERSSTKPHGDEFEMAELEARTRIPEVLLKMTAHKRLEIQFCLDGRVGRRPGDSSQEGFAGSSIGRNQIGESGRMIRCVRKPQNVRGEKMSLEPRAGGKKTEGGAACAEVVRRTSRGWWGDLDDAVRVGLLRRERNFREGLLLLVLQRRGDEMEDGSS